MSETPDPLADLADNTDPAFWGGKLDALEARLTELHKRLDGRNYTRWGLLALKALDGDTEAAKRLSDWPAQDPEQKRLLDELSLINLTLPVVRHFHFRAINRARSEAGG